CHGHTCALRRRRSVRRHGRRPVTSSPAAAPTRPPSPRSPALWRPCWTSPGTAWPSPGPGLARRDRRVAARNRATAQPRWPRPEPDGEPQPAAGEGEQEQLAAVIPLAVFDAREEAKKWW